MDLFVFTMYGIVTAYPEAAHIMALGLYSNKRQVYLPDALLRTLDD